MNKLFCKILKTLILIFCLAFLFGFGIALALYFHDEPELALRLMKIGSISFAIYSFLCGIYQKVKKLKKENRNHI